MDELKKIADIWKSMKMDSKLLMLRMQSDPKLSRNLKLINIETKDFVLNLVNKQIGGLHLLHSCIHFNHMLIQLPS